MSLPRSELVSAEVILHSASGREFDGRTAITAENVAHFAPSPEAVARASRGFASLGFDVGSPAGLGFSITARAAVFEEVFGGGLMRTERGGIECSDESGATGAELGVDRLPQSLREVVRTVTFIPPPDFGPARF